MEITTVPSCRVGSQGQTLRYVVRATGATELQVPEHGFDGMQVRIADVRPTADGVEGDVEVKVLDATLV